MGQDNAKEKERVMSTKDLDYLRERFRTHADREFVKDIRTNISFSYDDLKWKKNL